MISDQTTNDTELSAVADTVAGPPNKPKRIVSAQRLREQLVLLSMGLVTAAFAATVYALFDFSLSSAVLSGGLVWAALMTLHMQIKKSSQIARLKAELHKLDPRLNADPVEHDGPNLNAPLPRTPPIRHATPQQSAELAATQQHQLHTALTSPAARGEPGDQTPSAVPRSGPNVHPRWEMAQPKLSGDMRSAPGTEPALLETALWPGTSLSVTDPMRDHWAFRPKDTTPNSQQVGAPMPQRNPTGTQPLSPPPSINIDLEMVQRKIKALAEEVNAAELTRDRTPSSLGPSASGQSSFGESSSQSASRSAATHSALENSIDKLKATADAMRERRAPASQRFAPVESPVSLPVSPSQSRSMPFELMIPATAERIAASPPPAPAQIRPEVQESPVPAPAALDKAQLDDIFTFATPPPPTPRLAAIVAALDAGAMDVFLSPIVALQSHQVSHYDVTVRLKNPSGAYLDDAEQELQLAGSDVLALFDTARLKRAAGLAQRLDAHSKPGSLLSAVNGPSITNAEFLEAFARVYEERDRISNQLVLTFQQADVERFSPSAWQALSDMHAFGFRFALAKIDHAGMDFAHLAKRGFAFLRLEADALINGLPARDQFLGPNELCTHLAQAGMTLVADTIDDEAIRARVFGFGVLFGQGRLFGGSRQVKLDPLPSDSSAAA